MRTNFILISLLAVLLLAGCASPGPRSRYLEQIDAGKPAESDRLPWQHQFGDSLPFSRQGCLRHGQLAGQGKRSGSDFQYRYAVLGFDKQPRANGNPWSNRAIGSSFAMPNDGRRWWMEFSKGSCLMSPDTACWCWCRTRKSPSSGTKKKRRGSFRLDQKPADIIVDRAFSQSDFSRKAIELLQKNVNQARSQPEPVSVRDRRRSGFCAH